MIQQLHNAGKKLLLWQAPVYKQMEPGEKSNRQNKLDWEEAIEQKLCVCFSDGTPYRIPQGKWFPGSMVPILSDNCNISALTDVAAFNAANGSIPLFNQASYS